MLDDWDNDERQNYYASQQPQQPQYYGNPQPNPQVDEGTNYGQQYPQQEQPYPQGGQQYPQQYTQQDLQQAPAGPPPKSNKKWLWIGIISAVVAVAVIVAALFVVPMFMQPAVVGTWHITEQDNYAPNGTLVDNESKDEYIVFNASGSGYAFGEYSSGTFKFTWKDIGNNQVELTQDSSSYSIKMDYRITGDKITLTMYYEGAKTVLSGVRVNSVPSTPSRVINSWYIYVDGKLTKNINATTQPDGSATWSGSVTIKVYDQNGDPLPNVKVVLDGCGITAAGETDSSGQVTLQLTDVTLPSGIQSDEIQVTLSYMGSTKTDTLTVIRAG